jgi:threonine dehydratase
MALTQVHHLVGIVRPVTLVRSQKLSHFIGADVLLAVETFQHTGSFKFRGAYNAASSVPNQHLVTASSGNFGQALAYACKLLGKRCHVVMPATSSKTKIAAVEAYGGEVDIIEIEKISRAERIRQLTEQFPDAYVASPFDDKWVIEGNATLGAELLASGEPFEALIAPVGGGGLSSGMARALQGKAKIYGAEPEMANDAARSLKLGYVVANEHEPQTLADGARTLSVGKLNWPILKDGLSGIFEVSEDQIREGVKQLFLQANVKAEPTGALTTGALLGNPDAFRGRQVCCIVSGGNVDPELYKSFL